MDIARPPIQTYHLPGIPPMSPQAEPISYAMKQGCSPLGALPGWSEELEAQLRAAHTEDPQSQQPGPNTCVRQETARETPPTYTASPQSPGPQAMPAGLISLWPEEAGFLTTRAYSN